MQDVSTLFELLADEHRRRVLVALCDVERIRVPDDLDARGRIRPEESGSAGRSDGTRMGGTDRRIRIALVHSHLPKLADAGLIEWDRGQGVVSRGPEFDRVEPVLRLLIRNAEVFPEALL